MKVKKKKKFRRIKNKTFNSNPNLELNKQSV